MTEPVKSTPKWSDRPEQDVYENEVGSYWHKVEEGQYDVEYTEKCEEIRQTTCRLCGVLVGYMDTHVEWHRKQGD